jgi:hypothetical protein
MCADRAEAAAAGAAAADDDDQRDAALPAMVSALEREKATLVASGEDLAARLDLRLDWLWRVHRLDYYGRRELLLEADYMAAAAAARMQRGPRPAEAQQQAALPGEMQITPHAGQGRLGA